MRRADGSVIPVILTSRAINYADEPSSIIGIFDLSERKAAEHEIQSQREALHQSEKLNALGTLLAGVAHELNNPLSVVVGHSFLLADTAMDEKVKNRAEKIGKAAQRCSAIVKNFLAMARQSKQVLSEVDINGVISGTLEITGYVLKTARIEIDTDLTKKLPSVWGDSDQIGQVVMNLVINAKQALETQEGQKRISIDSRISADKKSVVIGVSDNGPGVPEDAKKRIFDPFYTTKGVGIGTGLGLSVSRGIVEAHHGSIAVRNNTDNGAVFEVRLPISQGHDKERRSRPSSQTTTNSYSILIVDDEPEVMETLSELLEAQGHRVIQAESGAAALHLLSELDCDLILCDLRMPVMDGPELYRQVCRSFPHLSKRIAFVTGDILDPSSGDFLEAANLPYLEKPFGPDEVQLTINNLMEH
jgi:signal transduction histidine kinase